MKIDKLKEGLDTLNTLLGEVDPNDFKQWVKNEQPTEEGYYIVLTGDSNPNFIHTCRPAVHFWYADKKEWSSVTTYWLRNVKLVTSISG